MPRKPRPKLQAIFRGYYGKSVLLRLIAIQLWLERGQRNIWLIFEKAGFVELTHLPDGGFLAMNTGIYDDAQGVFSDAACGDGD